MTKPTGVLLLVGCVSGFGQTVQYSSLMAGGKLPYGKNVTITGTLKDIKCGAVPITDLLNVSSMTASYLGQTSKPATGTISGDIWSIAIGSLPAETAINLTLQVSGKIAASKQSIIVDQLMASDAFKRRLQAFVLVTTDQAPIIVTQETGQLLKEISEPNGLLSTVLQNQLPCVSITDMSAAAVTGLQANHIAFVDLLSRYKDVLAFAPPQATSAISLQGLDQLSQQNHGLTSPTAQDDLSEAAKKFADGYQKVLSAFQFDVVAQISAGVQMDVNSVTTDFAKYAAFDVGAVYVPRINELRQFFIGNIYPFGPVDLDTNGVALLNWKSRFSLSLGFSLGDLSANAKSRVKSDKAFMYGLGYRINKYFRLTMGAVVYRDSGSGNGLLNEASVGTSVDLTALPGLKQIFASASGKSSPSPATQQQGQQQQGQQQQGQQQQGQLSPQH